MNEIIRRMYFSYSHALTPSIFVSLVEKSIQPLYLSSYYCCDIFPGNLWVFSRMTVTPR